MAEGVGREENIELDNMNKDDDNDQDNDDNENTKLINDQIQSTSTHKKLMPPLEKPGARPKIRTYDNPSYVIDDIPTVDERMTTLTDREKNQNDAWDEIITKFPDFKPVNSKFTARVDEFGRVKVKLARRGSVEHNFFDENGELSSKLPETLKKSLGQPVETVIEKVVNKIKKWRGKNREDKAQLDRVDISEGEIREITERIETRDESIGENEREIEVLEGRMKLKDRIKSIFKRHGFTVIAVISAVGAVIGVIVSNLKTGFAKMAKGVGNGLKEIGKKLGAILPGMIGAIVSFIFKTAGEVVGFIAKNAWLLIIAVVIFGIDQFKSRASTKSFKKKNK